MSGRKTNKISVEEISKPESTDEKIVIPEAVENTITGEVEQLIVPTPAEELVYVLVTCSPFVLGKRYFLEAKKKYKVPSEVAKHLRKAGKVR